MTRIFTTFLVTLAACITTSNLRAQPTVDITLADNGDGQLEVRLRPNGPFNGVVSNIVFTLHWSEQFGSALEILEPAYPVYEYIPVAQNPLVSDGNGTLYRTISVVGMVPMSDFGASWEPGREYAVCTINVLTPGADVSMADNAYTVANNRNFFCSLNGLARTGVLFESGMPLVNAKALIASGHVDVVMTPEQDFFGWVSSVDLTLRWPAANGATLGGVSQSNGIEAYLTMEKVGTEVAHDGFVYQRFHGTGLGSTAHFGSGWPGQADQVIFSVPVIGTLDDVVVTNDAYATSIGGSYAVFLNGQPRTGTTDEQSTGLSEAAHLDGRIITQDGSLVVILDNLHERSTELILTNTVGATVARHRLGSNGDGINARVDISTLGSGVYFATVRNGDASFSQRFVR